MDREAFYATLCILGMDREETLALTPEQPASLAQIATGPRDDRVRFLARTVARIQADLDEARAR